MNRTISTLETVRWKYYTEVLIQPHNVGKVRYKVRYTYSFFHQTPFKAPYKGPYF